MAIPFSYGLRNLWTRKVTSALTAGGMALVTFVFAAVLMLAEGLEQTLRDTGSPDNAIGPAGGRGNRSIQCDRPWGRRHNRSPAGSLPG